MNELQDRPYVCGAPGCSQRFQSEEHLNIHRHKHEMTLKFNSIKNDFTADTPTPTKFLQNCDEVGLFKEIEEEFLQAQEEEKKQMLPQNGPSCLNQSHLKDQSAPLSHQPLTHPPPAPQHHTHTHSHNRQPPHHHNQPHHPPHHHPPHSQTHQTLNQPHSQPLQPHNPPHNHTQPHSQPLQHPPAHGPLMGPSCSLAPHQTGSVIAQNHSHSGPVPNLSSLLHMRSRHRQPLPASLPGTLPDPAMQGAAAHHIHRLKHPLGPPYPPQPPQPRLMSMNRAAPPWVT
ncbi:cyclic AMP-responsive element-binding protein 5-like [Boleophthalmus pectinirostris]|uniref:cyclic AMP-responsive element-binding protein 5-like n=1 Tax=Boleophthalmus pectinirostris TaxID=150288 RepID=UPI0024314A97|nr:cyclic AMP-responsive element-binding protein 5-like [Boleophthalmus pectinirostris]